MSKIFDKKAMTIWLDINAACFRLVGARQSVPDQYSEDFCLGIGKLYTYRNGWTVETVSVIDGVLAKTRDVYIIPMGQSIPDAMVSYLPCDEDEDAELIMDRYTFSHITESMRSGDVCGHAVRCIADYIAFPRHEDDYDVYPRLAKLQSKCMKRFVDSLSK